MMNNEAERYIGKILKPERMWMNKWNYEDGCILLGAIKLYEACRKEKYKEFVLWYLDEYVEEDGTIKFYSPTEYNLDNIAPGPALIFAYGQTGKDKYRLACDRLMAQLRAQPRTASGNFWHKQIYPQQVWLDGLFMAQPFYAAYERKFAAKEGWPDTLAQFQTVRKHMYSEEKGLYYHGFDESGSIFWADPDTGCSASFWLRSEGWHLLALLETASIMEKDDPGYGGILKELLEEAVSGILRYQDEESGLFYQLTDRPELEGNYLETSGSLMVAAAILGGCAKGFLPSETYRSRGERILNGILRDKLAVGESGEPVLKDACKVAGLGPAPGRRDGSPEYYLSEPVVCDDKKAAGVFLIAAAYREMLCGPSKE